MNVTAVDGAIIAGAFTFSLFGTLAVALLLFFKMPINCCCCILLRVIYKRWGCGKFTQKLLEYEETMEDPQQEQV